MSDFYLEYHKILTEVMLFLENPKIIVSVHTHKKNAEAGHVALYRPYVAGAGDGEKLMLVNAMESNLQ